MQRHVGRAVDRDLDHPGAGRERLAEVGERRRSAGGGRPKSAAARPRSSSRGVPSRASNSSGVELRGLGQEVEDPAAAVGDDHDPHRGVDVGQGREPAEVVEQAEVAGDDHRGPPARRRGADPDETSPSMPLAPRLARKSSSASEPVAGTPPGRGSACSTPCRRARRPRTARRALPAGRARSVRRAARARPRSRRAPGASASVQARAQPCSRDRAVEPLRDRGRERPRARANDRPAVRVGSFQPWAASTTSCGTPSSSASHWRSGLQVGSSPKRSTRSGASWRGRARATAS